MRPSALLISSILLLGACADRATLHVLPEAKEVGTIHEIYVATNRGRRAEDGAFDESRSETTSFLKAQVSVPPSHEAGRTQTNARNPSPERDFVIAAQTELRSKPTFQSELRKSLASHPSADRDVTLFVHGYNTSYSEGLFRLAQVDHDMQPPAYPCCFPGRVPRRLWAMPMTTTV